MAAKFAVSFAPGHPSEFVTWCKAAEDFGFEKIGVIDSQSIYRELYTSCTLGLQATSVTALGPRVTNPVTRHITVTASALLTLNELAPDRVFVAIGTGDSALINVGLRPVKLAALSEFLQALRALLSGETVQYENAELRLPWGNAHIPIYVAAHGPRTLELAGEFADGIMVGTGVGDQIVQEAFTAISRGAARAGRSLEHLDIWWHLAASMAGNRQNALAQVRFNLASKVNHLLRNPNANQHLPPEYCAALEKIHHGYDYLAHLKPDAGSANAALVQESGLEDYLARRYAIIGTPAQCAATLSSLEALGVEKVWLNIYSHDNLAFMRSWQKEIMLSQH